jgi:hypothetical protein
LFLLIQRLGLVKLTYYAYLEESAVHAIWHRVRFYRPSPSDPHKKAVVYFVDLAQAKEVEIGDNFRQLDARFSFPGSRSFFASIVYAKPKEADGGSGEDPTNAIWPENATEAFKALTQGKVFHTVIVSKREVSLPIPGLGADGNHHNHYERTLRLTVSLYEEGHERSFGSIQEQLIRLGFATGTGLLADINAHRLGFAYRLPKPK